MNGYIRRAMLALLVTGLLGGCSSMPQAEPQTNRPIRTTVKMTVVYAKRDRINEVAKQRGFQSQTDGFYDKRRGELWCPDEETKEAFSTCGHELQHVVKGDSSIEKLNGAQVLARAQ